MQTQFFLLCMVLAHCEIPGYLDIEARDPYSEEEIFGDQPYYKILGGLIGTLLQFSYGVHMKVSDHLPCLSSSKVTLIMPHKQLIGQSKTITITTPLSYDTNRYTALKYAGNYESFTSGSKLYKYANVARYF